MKALLVLSGLLLTVLGTHGQSGGAFVLKSSVIAGGGVLATSVDGRFTLKGTAGQPEPGAPLQSPDHNFVLVGGFWHGLSVQQSPGAPRLNIRLGRNATAVLSWDVNVSGYILEETGTVPQPETWSATLQAAVNTATEHTVTVNAAGVMKVYRLRKVN